MKRILVTGGAGFIGSHLCRRLVGEGHHVTVLDNFSTGRHRADLAQVIVYGDVSSGADCDNFWPDEFAVMLDGDDEWIHLSNDSFWACEKKYDEIYHLACPASPKAYQADPISTMLANVMGSRNVLGLARRHSAKVLLASTSEVYGDPLVSPQREDYLGNVNCTGPRACYDEGKRAAECLFFDYYRQYGTRIKVARIFNTYGPGMAEDDGRVVSNFIVQALRGEPLTIYGDGSQTRSFCYVDDTVEGLVRLMESPDEVTGPVNLGNQFEVSMSHLASLVCQLTDAHGIINHSPLPTDDPMKRCPDITRAQMYLDWDPEIGLGEGLVKTIDYFRSRMEEARVEQDDMRGLQYAVLPDGTVRRLAGPLDTKPGAINYIVD
jgi:UDP-glucuronate decarboxylase